MPFGFLSRRRGGGELEPYTGEAFPPGTLGAVAVGGELMVDLEGGSGIEVVFRVRGKPAAGRRHSDHGNPVWPLPELHFSLMPADDATPRLQALNPREGRVRTDLDRVGWSQKAFGWFEVPPPGGRYLMRVTGPVDDPEAHVVLIPL